MPTIILHDECDSHRRFSSRGIIYPSHRTTPLWLWLVLLVLVFSLNGSMAKDLPHSHSPPRDLEDDNEDPTQQQQQQRQLEVRPKMIIGFVSDEARESYYASVIKDQSGFRSSNSINNMKKRVFRYSKSPAVATALSITEIDELMNDPRVAYVQQESQLRLMQKTSRTPPPTKLRMDDTEVVPYGIKAVQATSNSIPSSPMYWNGTCANPNSFKICVIDTGLYVAHRDIPYEKDGVDIKGMTMGLPSGRKWFRPNAANLHGTHVTGTILAKGKNGIGVVGVLPNKRGMCLLVAPIFDTGSYQDESIVTEAMEWCGRQGARVINLSASGSQRPSPADEATLNQLVNDDGILIIAAAGNEGTEEYAYPASLPSVISVGATTRDNQRASFSQYNDQVDLVAPGVDILSTVPSRLLILNKTTSFNRTVLRPVLMGYSVDIPWKRLKTPLDIVYCGRGFEPCSNARNKICVIERGVTVFYEKALNCQRKGGIGVLIFNNEPGLIYGSLRPDGVDPGVRIPVLALSQDDGRILLRRIGTKITITSLRSSYASSEGTSMSTPHVAGVAAKIWSIRPSCTNKQIREALEQSAYDLGDVGRDDQFGHGLVQAEAAYEYLLSTFEFPCGERTIGPTTTRFPSFKPTTLMPTQRPTVTPPTRPISFCLPKFSACTNNADCCSGQCGGAGKVCKAVT